MNHGSGPPAQSPGIAFYRSVSVVGPAISTMGNRTSSSRPGQQWTPLPDTGINHIVPITRGSGNVLPIVKRVVFLLKPKVWGCGHSPFLPKVDSSCD